MSATVSNKTNPGNFFEDFHVGQVLRHATPRTVTEGDVALYVALTGNRFAVQSSTALAEAIGYGAAPVDDWLVFHIVFGKTVPDISLNAVANLGYADGRFLAPVYVGDTLSTVSEVIGVKQNSNGRTGVVYVRSCGVNQRGESVLEYVRWVMVHKRDPEAPAPQTVVPELPGQVGTEALGLALPSQLDMAAFDMALVGGGHRWADYRIGERIDHVDGMTLEEAEHQLATRLYQNTAKVHFNQLAQSGSKIGRRLVYGGHVISLARALSFNGLETAFHVSAINAGRHVNPCFAGDTIFAWSEVLDVQPIPTKSDVGALRLRTVATKNAPATEFPDKAPDGKDDPNVILDLDTWVCLPR